MSTCRLERFSRFILGRIQCELHSVVYAAKLRSRMRYLLIHVGLIGIVLAAACSYPATQTIVEIQADAVVRQRASEIRVDVRASNGSPLRETIFLFPQSQSFPGFPIRIPVSARSGQDARNFEIRVAAVDSQMAADGTLTVTPLATIRSAPALFAGRCCARPCGC